MEALNLSQGKSVRTPAVESCSWVSMQMDNAKREPSGDTLGEEETLVYRCTVARLNNWAVGKPDIQHAVGVCVPSLLRIQQHMTGRS